MIKILQEVTKILLQIDNAIINQTFEDNKLISDEWIVYDARSGCYCGCPISLLLLETRGKEVVEEFITWLNGQQEDDDAADYLAKLLGISATDIHCFTSGWDGMDSNSLPERDPVREQLFFQSGQDMRVKYLPE